MRYFLLKLLFFGVFLGLFLEVLMRTAIPASETPVGRQDPVYMIMTLDPNAARDGYTTQGRLGRDARRWHVNNYGFNSDYDYERPEQREQSCVAVIGNSYVEGMVNNVDEHLVARLQQKYGDRACVYNLGVAGMPFSQYPLMTRFAQEEFAPDLIVFAVGGSSLDRSLRSGGLAQFCQQYTLRGDSLIALPPTTFRVKRKNRLIRASAVIRYLFYNARVNLGGAGDVVQAAEAKPDSALADDPRARAVHDRVLDRIFQEIATAAPGTPLLVVMDADRREIYADQGKPAPLRDSPAIEAACSRNGAHFLDLTDHFWTQYQQHGRPFNSPIDYHWNEYGVEVVRDAIWTELTKLGLSNRAAHEPSS